MSTKWIDAPESAPECIASRRLINLDRIEQIYHGSGPGGGHGLVARVSGDRILLLKSCSKEEGLKLKAEIESFLVGEGTILRI